MYGNYLSSPFMMPNGYVSPMMMNINKPLINASRGFSNGLRPGLNTSNGIGGILSGIKNINWSGVLNNTSKTLGVVKDAIPVFKEVRPMISNMKSMLKIASAFNDVTIEDNIKTETVNTYNNKNTDIINNTSNIISNENEPNFFL